MFFPLLQRPGSRLGFALHATTPRLLMAAVVLGSGGWLLAAGSAHATASCTFTQLVNGCTSPLVLGDKKVSVVTIPTQPANSFGAGKITLADVDTNIYSVNVTFDDVLSTINGGLFSGGVFAYNIEITEPDKYYFSGVQLTVDSPSSNGVSVGATVTKTETSNPGPLFAEINSIYGQSPVPAGFEVIPGTTTKLSVRDTYSVSSGSGLKSFTNTFRQAEVPGPLPLVGAGVAFGFSRKLRSRIQAAARAKA